MGTFRVEIEAVGGHGCQRLVGDGEVKKDRCQDEYYQDKYYCVDCAVKEFVEELKKKNNVVSATLTHWPGTPQEITDDLLTMKRKGAFL